MTVLYNNARVIPLYPAEIQMLQETDPEKYEEFLEGNWVVNKNLRVPFCALGADHATQASAGQIVELQEDWNLFVHMMVICKSRPEIDIQEAVGTNEKTVVPISMFAPDGEMLQCPAKSALLSILEKLPANTDCSCYSS